MAPKSSKEFKVGLLILIGIIMLAVSLYWLQGYKLESNAYVVRVHFEDVGTLSVGDKVAVSGVHKGKVNAMALSDTGVVVELLIYQDVVLRSDATFRIRNMGVMGERYIAIDPGAAPDFLETSGILPGDYDVGIPEVMGMIGEVVSELKLTLQDLRTAMGPESTIDRLNKTLGNLESVTATMASFLADNRSRMDTTALNMLEASRDVRRIVSGNVQIIDSTLTRFNRASVGFEAFVNTLDSLSNATRRLARAFNEGDGTLQALLEDRRLYDDLRRTADDLDDLILDIRQNPDKYINLKFELF
ncbi:MAG: MlaD family protein [candidate division Zixibacteria bacterium]|jgi:phospholipid/cholesterol/gamma-HCH transport system substrate-binding protein|nr:MlaD family protein [candidate division Zixibacteria bacterium]